MGRASKGVTCNEVTQYLTSIGYHVFPHHHTAIIVTVEATRFHVLASTQAQLGSPSDGTSVVSLAIVKGTIIVYH
ncbi:hypothetical protein FOZ62_026368 [Perkinsus olseni]|uniref:Uncharacterized protein n=1 Tax=Perkinsus olseni TaxID=32597 RepID=A0A7J6T0K8_PEROL|nr:hypothetical protein FOZ62_026368 [Perkinsus olseni]